MPVRFTLEKRTDLQGNSPIRLSWSFGGLRYQTTIGFSVKKEDWNETLQMANNDNLGYTLRRIKNVVDGIEEHFMTHKRDLSKDLMKRAISDALSIDIAQPADAIERCVEGIVALPMPQTRYYRDRQGKFYRFICDACSKYCSSDRFYILQELFGQQRRVAVSERDFKPQRITGEMYPVTIYEEVGYEVVFGK